MRIGKAFLRSVKISVGPWVICSFLVFPALSGGRVFADDPPYSETVRLEPFGNSLQTGSPPPAQKVGTIRSTRGRHNPMAGFWETLRELWRFDKFYGTAKKKSGLKRSPKGSGSEVKK